MTGRWYHRHINGVEAERLLQEYGQDGSFLIRPSQSSSNSNTLSVRCQNTFKHIKIQNNGDCYEIGECGDKFATLAELVEHFILKETLRDKNDGTILVLKYPLSYKEPTTERYYHGAIPGSEATNLLLEKGKPGSYLVRESRSDPQNYVLCVKCENNKIVHLIINYSKKGYTMQNYDQSYPSLDVFINELVQMCPIVDSKDNVIYLKQPLNASRVNAINLNNRVRDLEKESRDKNRIKNGFAEEFEALQQQDGKLLYNRKEGDKAENRNKNRFKTILPFDHTRVCLRGESDYINANYIKSEDSFGKSYLATQGPLQNTIGDFWRMVWQESSKIILMITHEVDNGRVKCCKYWPELNEQHINYDCIRIKCVDKTQFDDYLLREFIISHVKHANEERRIFHFQYLAWSDHGVPENVKNTLNFIEHVNRLYKQENCTTSTITVHCSAGIGRTGAVIVLDMTIDKIRHYGIQCDIDVQKTVLHVRSQRSGLVQTEKQYQFLYTALREYIDRYKSQQLQKQQEVPATTTLIPASLKQTNKQQKPIYLVNTTTNSKESMNYEMQSQAQAPVLRRSVPTTKVSPPIPPRSSHRRDTSNLSNEFTFGLTSSSIMQDDGYLIPNEYSNDLPQTQRKPLIAQKSIATSSNLNSTKNFNQIQNPMSVYMNLHDSNTATSLNKNQNLVIRLKENSTFTTSSSNSSSNIQQTSRVIQAMHVSSTRPTSNKVPTSQTNSNKNNTSASSKSSFNSNSTAKVATSIVPLSARRETSGVNSLPRQLPSASTNNRVISATSSRGMSASRHKR